MIRLNLIPFGNRGTDAKGESFPFGWKKYREMYSEDIITEYDNVACITGKLPKEDLQIVVIDFDGVIKDTKKIFTILKSIDVELCNFYQIVRTGNLGRHFFYICDNKNPISNKQKMQLKPNIFPKNIKSVDIRANGGLVYYPPTEFINSRCSYKITYEKDTIVIPSEVLVKFIDYIYVPKKRKKVFTIEGRTARRNFYKTSMRKPLYDLLYGVVEIIDISERTGFPEFLYWMSLFLEVIHKRMDMDYVFKTLEKSQPEFDIEETNHQLQYLDGKFPFTNEKLMEMFPYWNPEEKKRKNFIRVN